MTPEPEAMREAIHEALRAWNTQGASRPIGLDELLLVQERQAELAREGQVFGGEQAVYHLLLGALEELEQQDETAARVLRWRFVDDNTLLMAADRLNVSEHTVSRLQRAGIGRLATIIHKQEVDLRERRVQQLEANLPPPSYTRLFGVEAMREELIADLRREEAPGVMAIVGIGGIGKTALADAATRELINAFSFDQVLWLRYESRTMSGQPITPRHAFERLLDDLADCLGLERTAISATERLAAIRRRLKPTRHLVVIDNLEDEVAADDLFTHLLGLADPGKFLLTMRSRPAGQAAVRNVSLPELSREDAARLLRHHATEVGITAAAEAADETAGRIYEITGGNPLALKLVVGLLDSLPLAHVLDQLAHSPAGPVEALYRHIYWQSWRTLGEPARALLQAMPLVAESGGKPEYLMAVSGLDEATFWSAVQQLRSRSLLEVRGTLEEKRYGVHRLTETFVRTEIVNWPEE